MRYGEEIPPIGFRTLESFSASKAGKSPDQNEDLYGFRADGQPQYWMSVISDGATSKNGFSHEGRSGGQWAAEFVVEACLDANKHGVELVGVVSEATAQDYDQINVNRVSGFAGATMLDARFVRGETNDWELVITQVGDSGFRLRRREGEPIIGFDMKAIDEINSRKRSDYIKDRLANLGHEPSSDEMQQILAEGRGVIQDSLNGQHRLQNKTGIFSPDGRPLGYGVIDGSMVPEELIKITREPAKNVVSLELFTDGYSVLPEEACVAAYEEAWRLQQERDPYALGDTTYGYPAGTKAGDDRTVVILSDMTY